jgi:hypothetical protein
MELTEETLAQLSAVTQSLKEKLGEDPDMWSKESRIR